MSKVDDTAISQDDSGALHASTLVIMSNDVGKPVESLIFDEFNQWAADAGIDFATDVKSEFRMLQGDLVMGVYDVENVLELRREVEGVEDVDEVKSIAEKTGNYSEFTDTKSTNPNKRYGVPDFEFPVECRECGENRRMTGSFRCPECHPDTDSDDDDYELVGKMMKVADKYLDGTGLSEDDFVPNSDVQDVVENVREFIDEHGLVNPDNQREGASRANQLFDHAENDEPLEFDYWEEIYNFHQRHRAQNNHECDESDLPEEAEEINNRQFDACMYDAGWFSDKTWGGDPGYEQAERIVTAVEDAGVEKMSLPGYPDIPDEAAPEASDFVERMQEEGYDGTEEDTPLLYQLLGSGTPKWKMSKEVAEYQDEPKDGAYCGNCEYAYYSNETGEFVCSQIRGKVDWEGWCRLWGQADPDPYLKERFGVPDSVEKSANFKIETITANGDNLQVRVADTPNKRYQGLSGISKDQFSEDGMLFVYPNEGTHRLVWRDSKFPLDVVHIEYDGIVSKVGSLKEKGDSVKGEGVFALEVPLGVVDDVGISKGDRLDVSDIPVSTADSSAGRFEKSLGGINYVSEKIRDRGEQLSLKAIDKIGEAHRQQVWPKELQKSPSWTGNDDVTQDTQEWVSSILELEDPMWDSYDNVPMAAGLTVKQELKESLTQHQGWSLDSIDTRLREEFPHMEPFERQRIARQEVAGVLNRSKIAALEARPGDPLVRWVGPEDDSTTDLCDSLREKTDDGVPFSEFMDMLKTHADDYGGTPRRVDQGLPHFLCRYTVEVVDNESRE